MLIFILTKGKEIFDISGRILYIHINTYYLLPKSTVHSFYMFQSTSYIHLGYFVIQYHP